MNVDSVKETTFLNLNTYTYKRIASFSMQALEYIYIARGYSYIDIHRPARAASIFVINYS